MRVSVNEPSIAPESKRFVQEALDTGWVSSAGAFIDRFERSFADYLGVKHAVTTTSGTTAIHLALATLNIGPGDEVLVPAFTMMGSILPILYTGARPVFVDCDPDIYTMDVGALERTITSKTKAIMPVHIYGHSADMDPILECAARRGIPVLEDAAEAHGARYKGRFCGSMGAMSCFSFYGNKILTTGEGGMVLTDDDELAARARLLKDLAHSPQKRFWHEELGFNYRMTNLQAALGVGQLLHIDEYIAKKQWMASAYAERLSGIAGLRLPITKSWATNVHWMYAVLLDEGFPMSRDAFRARLAEAGVDTREYFSSCAAQPVVQKMFPSAESFPVTERIAQRGLYLPSGLALTEEQLQHVCTTIIDLLHR